MYAGGEDVKERIKDPIKCPTLWGTLCLQGLLNTEKKLMHQH